MNTILYNIHSANDCPVIAGDLLIGSAQIGRELGISPRRANHFCTKGILPAFKLGGMWCARRSEIIAHIESLEKGQDQPRCGRAPKVSHD